MKKRVLSMMFALLLAVCMLPALVNEASAAGNPYPTYQDADGDGQGELPCTYYAWQQAYDRLGLSLPAWGNAINWYSAAQNAGYSVGTTAQANSIAVWSISSHSWGHVAFVTAVNGSQMTVNEGGRTDREDVNGVVNGQSLPSTVNSNWYGRTLIGFIYLSSAPTVTVSWDTYGDKHSIGNTNAVLAGWANLNVDNSAVSQVGIYLYDSNGKQLASKTENVSFGGYNYFSLWYDVNSELGYTLLQGTPYKYKFFAVIGGKTYDSPLLSFTTGGTHSHRYDGGTVTKEATCSATGIMTYTCTTCGSSKTESISTKAHNYANATCSKPKTCKTCGATLGSALGHDFEKATCTKPDTCKVCGKTVGSALGHDYGNGTVTKAATCKNTGVMTYSCKSCKTTKTETIAKLTTHTYDHICDTACNVCGATRAANHQYSSDWAKDPTSHWHPCGVCGDKSGKANHVPGDAATESKPQTCKVCGYVIQAALGHTHIFEGKWSADTAGHWNTCVCGDMGNYAAHSYQDSCDADCDICGKERVITHTPGETATETQDQVCQVCGEVLAPAFGEPDQETSPEEETAPAATEPPQKLQQDSAEEKERDNGKVWLLIVAVVALAGGFFIGRIKKKA